MVTIDKRIRLTEDKTATYTVRVEGDIWGDNSIIVTPSSSVVFQDKNGKEDIVGTVTQSATVFLPDDISSESGVSATGLITAMDLTAGDWEGIINFDIDIGITTPGLYDVDGNLLCDWRTVGIDVVNADDKYPIGNASSAYSVLTGNYTNARKVILPKTVTSLGFDAFYKCSSLTDVVMPNTLTNIGDSAFLGCTSLVNAVIPDSVEYIGKSGFAYCDNLKTVSLSNNLWYIDEYTFAACPSLLSINLGSAIEDIRKCAFLGCADLESVDIPDSVECIGDQAFEGCSSLVYITLSDNISALGRYPFINCDSLSSITYRGNTYTNDTELIDALVANGVDAASDTFIGTGLYSGEEKVLTKYMLLDLGIATGGDFISPKVTGSIVIPEGITILEDLLFANEDGEIVRGGMTSATLPSSLKVIGVGAFYCCVKLTDINIPETVVDINHYAFSCCIGLTTITIPDSVEYIGSGAFSSCQALSRVVYKGVEYTSKSAIIEALEGNGVELGEDIFTDTALTD